ncbi:MAG: saccharopine dehydrogenase NADP-binding domain-containing protein [Myxococcota bacterium]|nr:saccharopine dehydrogenase NADP-binding domain-containing protein [Myxococcota bacterium]
MRYRLGLLGLGIQNSLSPALHQAAARSCGLEVDYELIDVDHERLTDVADHLKRGRWHGLNVTAPYKHWAFKLVSERGQHAAELHSVNTISRAPHGPLRGLNTDWFGIEGLLANVPHGGVLILGSGRMAESCLAWLLANGHCGVTVAHRSLNRFIELQNRAPDQVRSAHYDELKHSLAEYQTVINCLPRQCYTMLDTWQWNYAGGEGAFIDLNYGRSTDRFLSGIDGLGRSVCDGVDALIEQGIESFYHWTGHRPSREPVMHAVKKASLSIR